MKRSVPAGRAAPVGRTPLPARAADDTPAADDIGWPRHHRTQPGPPAPNPAPAQQA
ncbi:hypothetical protein [Streptomyces sp. NPDC005423]|uniref:hypothetical protein n=1 Tax=Streptomyces sp. NPDC005423 TaxID=3155343 RepID=UPI0033B41000